jgi:hypothetical protein
MSFNDLYKAARERKEIKRRNAKHQAALQRAQQKALAPLDQVHSNIGLAISQIRLSRVALEIEQTQLERTSL